MKKISTSLALLSFLTAAVPAISQHSSPGSNPFSHLKKSRVVELSNARTEEVVRVHQSETLYLTSLTSGELEYKHSLWLTYDRDGNITTKTEYKEGTTDSTSKSFFKYNSQGNVTEYLYQIRSAGQWSNSQKMLYSYDINGDESGFERYSYDDVSNQWILEEGERATYVYQPGSNLILEEVEQTYEDNVWSNKEKSVYTYNSANKISSLTRSLWENEAWVATGKYLDIVWNSEISEEPIGYITQKYANGEWQNVQRYSTSVNELGAIELTEIFENGNWANSERTVATNDQASRRKIRLDQNFENGQWVTIARETESYNSQGMITQYKSELYIDESWVVSNEISNSYTFNSTGDLIELVIEKLEGAGVSKIKTTYSDFKELNVITSTEASTASYVQTFPNPAKEYIKIQNALNESLQVQLYNTNGALMHQEGITVNETVVNLMGFPKGIYLMKLVLESGKSTSRNIVIE